MLAPALTSTTGRPTVSPDDDAGDGDGKGFLSVGTLRRQYLDYLTGKALEIEEQKQARHYYHGAQWTAEQVRILRKRHQPVITYNRVGRKINGIVGIAEKQRQDPKAYPRKPNSDEEAEVATATIRYITDAADWNFLKPECLRQAAIEGIAGIELKLVEGDKGDPDIRAGQILGDDFFYDARSVRVDFDDARYKGVAKWLDLGAAIELFPDKADVLTDLVENGSELTTYADREFKWIYTNERRVRLVEHWYKHHGRWCWAFYVSSTLLDEGVSPFRDERGATMSRFIMFSAAVDHDGDRYGFVRNLIGPQDEINQRRSKALHISNSKRLIMTKGAVDDVEIARSEWARADGVIEKNPGGEIDPDNTTPDLAAQFQFLEEAKNEMEGFANINPAALAGPGVKNLSGRAVNMLQQPGLAELSPFLIAARSWSIRVYRAMWCAARTFWTAERWIRVTGDNDLAQFIQLNGIGLDQSGNPVLINSLGALDVDIIVDEGPDVINMMSDTFDVLSQFPPGAIPPSVLIDLAPIQASQKRKIEQMMQPKPDPAKMAAQQIALAGAKAKVSETEASTVGKRAKALSDIASAAHKGHEAHLNAAQFVRDGFQDSAQSGGAPIGPDAPPKPIGPIAVPGAPPLPPNAPLAAALMQHLQAVPGAAGPHPLHPVVPQIPMPHLRPPLVHR